MIWKNSVLQRPPVLIQFSLSENNFQQYSVLGCIGVKKCNRLPSAVKNYSHVLPYFPIKTMNGTIVNNHQVSIYHWLIEFVCWNLYLIKNKNCKTSFHIAENCFLKVKTVLKQERFLNIVRSNLKVAIGQTLQEITIHDLKEFCVATGCLNAQWILCVRTSVRRTMFNTHTSRAQWID
jgi:hypothetical protein